MKKKISIALVLVMMLTLIPTSAFGADVTHKHCACGNKVLPVGNHNNHGETLEYKLLPKDGGVLEGNYYVETSTPNQQIVVKEGTTLNLCLNGTFLSSEYMKKNTPLIVNHGTLNIGTCNNSDISNWSGEFHDYDELFPVLSKQGKITGGEGESGTLIETTGDVNLYSGAVCSAISTEAGLIKVLPGGTFTMNGGSLHTGETLVKGGLIDNQGGSVVINDGILAGGKSVAGGAIYNKGDLRVNGGQILHNIAKEGGAIYHESGSFNIEGKLNIAQNLNKIDGSDSNIFLAKDQVIEVTGSLSGLVFVTAEAEGVVAKGSNGYLLKESDLDAFKSDSSKYEFVLDKANNCVIIKGNEGGQIVSQPKDCSIEEYDKGIFEIEAKNIKKYQWQKSTDDGATWVNKKGATKATYATGKATIKSNGSMYRCLLTDIRGNTIASKEVVLKVSFRTPLPCRIVRCADDEDKAVIRWAKENVGPIPQGYRVYRSENEYDGFKPIKNKNGWVKSSKGKTLTDYDVKEGKTYYYKVKPYIKNSLNKCVFGKDYSPIKVTIK